MNIPTLRRSLVVVTMIIAGLIIPAAPAAATTHTIEISDGTIVLSKTGVTEVIDLGASNSCTNPSTVTTDDGTGTTLTVTALSASHVQHFSTSGSYLMVLTRSTAGNTAGALNSTVTPHTITNMRVAVVATFYNTTSCTPTGTPLCTVAFLLNLSGTSTSTSTGSTFSLTGSSVGTVVAFPTCAAGPSHILTTSSTTTSPMALGLGSDTEHGTDVTGGDLTFTGTSTDSTLPLAGGGTGCDTTMRLSFNHNSYRGEIVAFERKVHIVVLGVHLVAIITRTTGTRGEVSKSATSGVIDSLTLTLQVDFFTPADTTSTNFDCVTNGGARIGRFTAKLHITGTFNHTSTSDSLTESNTVHLNSTTASTTAVSPIDTALTSFVGGTVDISSLSFHTTGDS